ncbi:MAG TPA: non-homologous end-joining DNA ligase [Candidatus Methylacidiphilales bacterium]
MPLAFVEPMKASTTDAPALSDPRWLYEVKFDGFRGLAIKNGKKVALLSRTRHSLAERFPDVVRAVAALPVRSCILDGEVCALDPQGRSSFQLLQNSGEVPAPIVYYVFDLLFENAKDLRPLPLMERKRRLDALLLHARDPIRPSVFFTDDAAGVLARMRAVGAEGAIAKEKDSPYRSGARSPDWVKIRFSLRQEFVIGGFTEPQGSRSGFGALLLGYYEGDALRYASKVGTGFDGKSLARLHGLLVKQERKTNPFADGAGPTRHRWSRGPLAKVHWVKPELVAQIGFTEWTGDGSIRHPVFLGLREDKPARRVVRELRTSRPASP